MFQVILIFSDSILIKQIIVSSTLSVLSWVNRSSKISTWSFDWGTGPWVKIHRFDVFSRNLNTINWKNFPHMVEHTIYRKFKEHIWREIKDIWKDVSLRLILKDKDKGGYQFVGSNLGIEILLKKREHHKKGVLK